MKGIFFSLLIIFTAFFCSSYKNLEKGTDPNLHYTIGYLVQTSNGVWTYISPEDLIKGTCTTLSSNPCIFLIKAEIPIQLSYSATEVLRTYSSALNNLEPYGRFVFEFAE